jgi:primosomal protein N'
VVIVECPWCDGPVTLEAEADELRCDACRIAVELATTPAGAPDLAAAA